HDPSFRALPDRGRSELLANLCAHAQAPSSARNLRSLGTLLADARFQALAEVILHRVFRWTGIPVKVGIGRTRTLAKVGSELAKMNARNGGTAAACLWAHPDRESFLNRLSVREVWGVGGRWATRLEAVGIQSVLDMACASNARIRKATNMTGLRTAYELRGINCIQIDSAPESRKTLLRSRSFRKSLNDPELISEALAYHAARAAETLRRNGQAAEHLSIFVTTKGHGEGPHRTCSSETVLDPATNSTPDLIRAAKRCLAESFEAFAPDGTPYRYKKAGVMLDGLRPATLPAGTLFEPVDPQHYRAEQRVLDAVDFINRKFGRQAVSFAAMGPPIKTDAEATQTPSGQARRWLMQSDMRSNRYTTRWNELISAGM
ncbi:MAG: DUF4113 domain-containing protein, partial [Rubricoccaceae bacterium]|nr:DUF4113 domain-containing protein [Rubricoccaceae bacterium]